MNLKAVLIAARELAENLAHARFSNEPAFVGALALALGEQLVVAPDWRTFLASLISGFVVRFHVSPSTSGRQ